MKRVILFDFDYTLGDSTDGIVESISHALYKMNLPCPSRDAITKTIGLSLARTYEALTGEKEEKKIRTFEGYFQEKADEVMVSSAALYHGVPKLLETLHEKGIETGIVTTKYHRRIQEILTVNAVERLVDAIVGGDDVKRPKPDPEGILSLQERFDIPPKEMLYVGDSVVDAQAAQAAHVDFIAVLTGTSTPEELRAYPCLHILRAVEELMALTELFP